MAPPVVVYVVVGVCSVAVVLAIKEFVYDPHVRPKLSEWWDARRSRAHAPMSASSRRNRKPNTKKKGSRQDSHLPLDRGESTAPLSETGSARQQSEHEEIKMRAVNEWRDGARVVTAVAGSGDEPSGLRHRNPLASASSATLLAPKHLMDEVDHTVLPTPALQPSRAHVGSSGTPDLPLPALGPSLIAQSYGTAHTLHLETPIAVSDTHPPTPDLESLSASVLTAAEGYFTPGSASTPSTPGTPRSPVASITTQVSVAADVLVIPDNRDGALSPLSDLGSVPSEFSGQSTDGDAEDAFSAPTHVISELDSDVDSDEYEHISEASSWADAAGH